MMIKDTKKEYTVSFITLGCKVNQFETEAMTEILEQEGYKVLPPNEISDIYIINTCAVTKESERKSRQFINKAKRINPYALVVAVGCSVQLNSEKINKETTADIIIGTKHKANIGKIIRDKLNNIEQVYEIEKFKGKENFEELKISTVHDKTRANIKIQDGCSQFCSYCIIPYVRGPIRSRNHEDIIKEVKRIAENGYKEIVLNGIHISSYGRDLKDDYYLIDLIEDINKIDGIQRIRLGSVEPNLIDEDFMNRYSALDKTCDHFHLSLQSGSNSVLKRMNRRYTKEEYKNKVDLIRKIMPDAGITTDIIVGFPGESDEEFNETVEFVKDIRFSRIHVFKYSMREGTKAAEIEPKVPDPVKSERSKFLIELGKKLSHEFMERFIGKDLPVLIETEKNKDIYEGYTTNYLKVLLKSGINVKNEIINVHIKGIRNDYLLAE
ncbi:MAG TPA: tRNA (N(6)-L-threonylcarbamoyladenosine(37)-C(2))-methylthiotransferase MtaB [Sedimentibacter sp.]|nr:tRNA (N(6)-L-threonylcarbamoyladenosine(37)-C(2))-methylthiotransferase MtaB [Sedimentibacter sp.]HHZ00212.1 tRNA (N(6)-L-threonylcarbamoyladenosine(37)-C(2))-methylthiotransferase MtaB [Tissierellia bacterium]HOW22005.1 tRNA (N(6)-L-threonylcarbamoyladenosine(37)-C(2))-methylthiotransferase MtaB [Sedimentibacter sp.]HRC80044.1 tRNA (N(6)-L-threonylcarbamoyladenosine(37)-C(2))-methylthiotransferase MtaB [Sedimentibacter sp.]